VEVLFEESRQVAGVGQARNRVRKAVERTVPFGLVCVSLVVVWYALHGQPALDVAARRALAPWYTAKRAPSFADMHAALRRAIIAAQICQPGRLIEPTPAEILQVQQAWPSQQHEVRKPSSEKAGETQHACASAAASRAGATRWTTSTLVRPWDSSMTRSAARPRATAHSRR
jgi:hypothetical protein